MSAPITSATLIQNLRTLNQALELRGSVLRYALKQGRFEGKLDSTSIEHYYMICEGHPLMFTLYGTAETINAAITALVWHLHNSSLTEMQ